MPADIRIAGTEQLADLSKKLKEVGNNELRKEMLRGIRAATKPMVTAVRSVAREKLPKHGGLNETVATAKIAVRTRTSGQGAGVRIVGVSSASNLRMMDAQGFVRHPVFGHRDRKWAVTDVPRGWFTDTMSTHAPMVRREIVRALDRVARRL